MNGRVLGDALSFAFRGLGRPLHEPLRRSMAATADLGEPTGRFAPPSDSVLLRIYTIARLCATEGPSRRLKLVRIRDGLRLDGSEIDRQEQRTRTLPRFIAT
jgi:hypothetical protein